MAGIYWNYIYMPIGIVTGTGTPTLVGERRRHMWRDAALFGTCPPGLYDDT
jgi:hypothetical protein